DFSDSQAQESTSFDGRGTYLSDLLFDDCKQACQQREECKGVTYSEGRGVCFLVTEISGQNESTDDVSWVKEGSAPNGAANALSAGGEAFTSFRGIALGMRLSELRSRASDGIEFEDTKDGLVTDDSIQAEALRLYVGQALCGQVSFDKDGRSSSLEFQRCFFGAADMTTEQFAQSIA